MMLFSRRQHTEASKEAKALRTVWNDYQNLYEQQQGWKVQTGQRTNEEQLRQILEELEKMSPPSDAADEGAIEHEHFDCSECGEHAPFYPNDYICKYCRDRLDP